MRQVIILTLIILTSVLVVMPPVVSIANRNFYRPRLDLKALGVPIQRDLDFKLGLDLQGGTHLVYQVDTSKISESDRDSAIKSTRDNIERRVNLLGVSESLVQSSRVGNDYRLIVELPGITDINQAVSTIGQTAFLEFR